MSPERSSQLVNLASMVSYLMNRDDDDDVIMHGNQGPSSVLESFLSSNNSGDSKYLVLDRGSGMLMDPDSGNMIGSPQIGSTLRMSKPYDEDSRQYIEDPYERDHLVEKLLCRLKEEF